MAVKIDGNGFISGLAPLGACRLDKSGTNLLLSPFNGNQLFIDGTNRPIPSAGVTLAQAALTASALNYIYAAWSGTAIVLEPAATAPVVETTYGTKVKTGDPTRALVGMCYPKAGPTLTDSLAARLVLSWFNPRDIILRNPLIAGSNTGSASYVELSTGYRLEFLTWANMAVEIACSGTMSNSSTATGRFGIGFDGLTPEDGAQVDQPQSNQNLPISITAVKSDLSEGYHYATLLAKMYAGSGLVFAEASGTAGDRSVMSGIIKG